VIRQVFTRLYEASEALNRRNIEELIRDRPCSAFCDLGCDDGNWTTEVALRLDSPKVFGMEIVVERARIARTRGVNVAVADLAAGFPFEDESFDIVHANQVIEHVTDVDHFLAETNRILRVGGAAVISTENGSSWHNILAATMGWQIFSLTNVSGLASGVGNPLALHRGGPPGLLSWRHKTIFNFRGLLEILGAHGLRVVRAVGAGYYPLPARFGRIDARHSHFITVQAVKTMSFREIAEARSNAPGNSRVGRS
jgi:SAM-dependent methyltransferase